jgi:hypothetical protein
MNGMRWNGTVMMQLKEKRDTTTLTCESDDDVQFRCSRGTARLQWLYGQVQRSSGCRTMNWTTD